MIREKIPGNPGNAIFLATAGITDPPTRPPGLTAA